jgi:hypothetical protein
MFLFSSLYFFIILRYLDLQETMSASSIRILFFVPHRFHLNPMAWSNFLSVSTPQGKLIFCPRVDKFWNSEYFLPIKIKIFYQISNCSLVKLISMKCIFLTSWLFHQLLFFFPNLSYCLQSN